jgi:outer membrane lipoprotein-sorting protein
MTRKIIVLINLMFAYSFCSFCQDANSLVRKVEAKLNQVNDYAAFGIMKTSVSFLKVPEAEVKIYYKSPNKLRIKNDKGISLVPKGAVSISFNNLLKGNFTVIDGGNEIINGKKTRVVKLLPTDDNSEMVLSTLYIDESKLLVLKAKINTKENGMYEVEMEYGKYESYALPDKVVFTFNPKDYKLPKGITFDYDDGSKNKTAITNTKGKVEITYSSYAINKGVSDAVFN